MTLEEKDSGCAAQSMQFIPHKRPVLAAGNYEVVTSHKIEVGKDVKQAIKAIERRKKINVRGERFQLDEADVHFCYPPMQTKGDFAAVLPHIVLKTATLPWQRSGSGEADKTPWLALLLFNADECESIVEGRQKIGELNRPPEWLDKSGSEGPDDQCATIEVPEKILTNIIPTAQDMEWLCHGRRITNAAKEDSADNGMKEYAVVVGNRLVQQGLEEDVVNRVYLVSLEGYHDKKTRESCYNPVDGKVQLVSLKRWEFTCTKDHYSFASEMKKLAGGVVRSSRQVQDTLLKKMLADGYILLPHQMRRGDKSGSFYRGPLVPSIVSHTLSPPLTCADQALRFYKGLGLFDVSYSAAWQLGRLLALQNSSFTSLLCTWKHEIRQAEIIQEGDAATQRNIGRIPMQVEEESEPSAKADNFAEVGRWLGELKRLNGIPLHYLVPEPETMLPENSIRFFNVDLNWTDRLIDGALSLGRTTTADLTRDLEVDNVSQMRLAADQAARCLRQNEVTSQDRSKIEAMSGVLIRSKNIVTWPGLEIEAFSDREKSPGKALAIVSIRRLTDTVLICLFEGNIARLDIHPPAEGLHYCFDPKTRQIRDPLKGAITEMSAPDPGQLYRQQEVAEGVKEGGGLNVLDIAGLADKIKAGFELEDKKFTSAQFGLSLLASTNRVTFLKQD